MKSISKLTASLFATFALLRQSQESMARRLVPMICVNRLAHGVIRTFLLSGLVAVVMIASGPTRALAGFHVVHSPQIDGQLLATAAIADNVGGRLQ